MTLLPTYLSKEAFGIYVIKFLVVFCLLYYGTEAVIGLSAPGGLYSPFIANYLDYVSWLKRGFIHTTQWICSVFGMATIVGNHFNVFVPGGQGIIVAKSCVGYGVYSFWIAFVAANKGTLLEKFTWIAGGLFGLWVINVTRITLFLIALNKGWPMPLGLDHHTWFNIFAYGLIALLIYLYDKRMKTKISPLPRAIPEL